MVRGIASGIVDVYARSGTSDHRRSLTTIALGTPVYGDIHIGSNHFPRDPVRDFIQLRVYRVDCRCPSALGSMDRVTQVAEGTAFDAAECVDEDVLHQYWLL